jgi:hypothetical protein
VRGREARRDRRRLTSGILLLALLAATGGCTRRPSASQQQAWEGELRRLTVEQDSLRARATALVRADPRMQQLPSGDVVMVVPTAFLRSVIEQVFDDVVGNVTLSVRGLKSHVAKSVHQVIPIGDYVLDFDVHELRGVLSPGRPDLGFGGNRVSMLLPVKLREGQGEATFHFVWKSKRPARPDLRRLGHHPESEWHRRPHGIPALGRDERGHARQPDRVHARVPRDPSAASRDALTWRRGTPSARSSRRSEGVCGWVLEQVDLPGPAERDARGAGLSTWRSP